MKQILKYCTAILLLFVAVGAYGQTTNVSIDSKTYYQHGYNSTGGPNLPQEARDSVTVGSVIKYFVLPSSEANPLFNVANPTDFTNVTSVFNWGFRRSGGAALGSITPSTPTNQPIISITWGNSYGAVDTIRVVENPANGCPGSETKIPVEIIAKPSITFRQVGSPLDYKKDTCVTQAQVTATITYNFPVAITSAVKPDAKVWVNYTVTKDGVAAPTLNGTNVALTMSSTTLGTFPIAFNAYGKYEVTITQITDRISRKSSVLVNGDIATGTGQSALFTFSIIKPVETGPIYRLPNNF